MSNKHFTSHAFVVPVHYKNLKRYLTRKGVIMIFNR
jgi:hypothetical protein